MQLLIRKVSCTFVIKEVLQCGHKRALNLLTSIHKHAKLSFLSAALDPQEMLQRNWSYEGFMPISWFGLMVWMCKFLGF